MDQDRKRELRQLKREIKQAGNQRVRRQLKRALAENPEDAPHATEPDYGRFRSEPLNGLDQSPPPAETPEGWLTPINPEASALPASARPKTHEPRPRAD